MNALPGYLGRLVASVDFGEFASQYRRGMWLSTEGGNRSIRGADNQVEYAQASNGTCVVEVGGVKRGERRPCAGLLGARNHHPCWLPTQCNVGRVYRGLTTVALPRCYRKPTLALHWYDE